MEPGKGKVVRVSVVTILLVVGLLIPSNLLAKEQEQGDAAKLRLQQSIENLLNQLDDELGGSNSRVALIRKKLDELVQLSLEQTQYNTEAAEGRASREAEDFSYEKEYTDLGDLQDEALIRALRNLVDNHIDLGYTGARKALFLDIDNFGKTIECVYTGRKMENVTHMPNASNMNTEHTWPQSQGATGTAKADLHHLFITDSKANSRRSSYPFGWVTNPKWEEGGSKLGNGVFQPRECHRGNVARAIFYFSVRYNKSVSRSQEDALRQWHKDDPVDEAELARNSAVFKYQHNRNPFVDHPEFVDRISDF